MSLPPRHTIFVIAASLLYGHTVSAVSANLLTNPDFDSNLNGWTPGDNYGTNGYNATFALNTTDGSPTAPSAEMTTWLNQYAAVTSDCITIDTSQNVDLYANVKIISGNDIGTQASIGGYMFNDTSCTGSPIGVFGTNPVNGSHGVWQELSKLNFSLLAGTRGVRIELYATGGFGPFPGAGDILFDHIVFQQAVTTPVRLQSFEVE
jgi:hypothetical protein